MAGFGCNGSSTRRADGVHSLRHPGWLQGALGVSATWDMRGCELRAKERMHSKAMCLCFFSGYCKDVESMGGQPKSGL